MLEERYAVSVATRNKAEALRLARLLYQQEPASLTRLDQLTWQLMQNGQSREAADLLLQRYPFQGDARVSQTLMARLASLLESHHLPGNARRRWQFYRNLYRWRSNVSGKVSCRVLLIIARQWFACWAICRLLTMLPPGTVWQSVIGTRYPVWRCMHGFRPNNDNPDAWQHRAVAYQAYQVEDYATAPTAWQKISLSRHEQ